MRPPEPGMCMFCSPYRPVPAARAYTGRDGYTYHLCQRHYEPLERHYRPLERTAEEWGAVRAWRLERRAG